jgi:SAM-dependent methyltransferase
MRQRIFAWLYRLIDPPQRRATHGIRRDLLADLAGRVIEVGCGPGANFPHYPPAAHVAAVDVNPHMLDSARATAAVAPAHIDVHEGDAGALPFEDGAFDAYVSSLVWCSVPHIGRAAAEAYRVLRPGGEARLFEHVRASGRRGRRLQRWANPLWGVIADGCHLDRDPAGALHAAGFTDIEVDRVGGGALPRVTIRARKPA